MISPVPVLCWSALVVTMSHFLVQCTAALLSWSQVTVTAL